MKNKQIDIDNLWIVFKMEGSVHQRQALILNYISLINYTISKMVLPIDRKSVV